MGNNRLLVIALVLIAVGLAGVFVSTWSGGGYQWFDRMSPMMNMMMNGGMMGRGMMDRSQMREMMQRMMPGMLPPEIRPEDLPDPNSRRAKLLDRYCSQCHNLPSPAMHSAEEWPQVANRMFMRMSTMSGMMGIESPSSEEQQAIVSYLRANSMKSISPDMLPSPQSQGAILFKEICSQCHALPDPNLHTVEEWPKVVERMRNNMQFMGKRVITDQEKQDIVGYLSAYARK